MERPYCIPIPDWASLPFIFLPTLGIVILFSIASWTTYVFVIVVFVLGILFHYLQQMGKKRRWCRYNIILSEADVDNNNEAKENINEEEFEECIHTDRTFSLRSIQNNGQYQEII